MREQGHRGVSYVCVRKFRRQEAGSRKRENLWVNDLHLVPCTFNQVADHLSAHDFSRGNRHQQETVETVGDMCHRSICFPVLKGGAIDLTCTLSLSPFFHFYATMFPISPLQAGEMIRDDLVSLSPLSSQERGSRG